MTEFIVLGLVPGTDYRVSLAMWLIFVAISTIGYLVLLKYGNILKLITGYFNIYWIRSYVERLRGAWKLIRKAAF